MSLKDNFNQALKEILRNDGVVGKSDEQDGSAVQGAETPFPTETNTPYVVPDYADSAEFFRRSVNRTADPFRALSGGDFQDSSSAGSDSLSMSSTPFGGALGSAGIATTMGTAPPYENNSAGTLEFEGVPAGDGGSGVQPQSAGNGGEPYFGQAEIPSYDAVSASPPEVDETMQPPPQQPVSGLAAGMAAAMNAARNAIGANSAKPNRGSSAPGTVPRGPGFGSVNTSPGFGTSGGSGGMYPPPPPIRPGGTVGGRGGSGGPGGSGGGNLYYETEETTVISRNIVVTGGTITGFANVHIDGSIKCDVRITKDVNITGKVVGDVACNNAVMAGSSIQGSIESKGQVRMDRDSVLLGDISTQYLDMNGRVKGNVDVGGKAEFKADAVIVGDITASTITVLDGAVIKGYVNTTFLQDSETNIFPEAITVSEQ